MAATQGTPTFDGPREALIATASLSYPLYDELVSIAMANQQNGICPNMNVINSSITIIQDVNHTREIFAIITTYYSRTSYEWLVTHPEPMTNLPFQGTVRPGGKGVGYKSQDLPPMLQYILAAYVAKYT